MVLNLRNVAANDLHDLPDAGLNGELPGQLPIAPTEARIRLVTVDDGSTATSDNWLAGWVAPVSIEGYNPFTVRAMSRSATAFDMIIIHAENTDTVIAFVRECGQMMADKLVVACLTATCPSASARILHAGADAVIDPGMGADVAAAYMRSLLRRSRMTRTV